MFASSPAFSSFAVDDTAKARSFYADTLGLQVEDLGMGGLLGLRLAGGGQVMVYPKPDYAPASYAVLTSRSPTWTRPSTTSSPPA